MNMVLLGLDILVFASLFLALLGGLIRGFGRTINKIIIFLIPVCLLFIFIKPISNKIVNQEIVLPTQVVEMLPDEVQTELAAELSGPISIKRVIVEVVAHNVYPNDASLQESSKLADMVAAMSEMIIMIGVYLSGLAFIGIARIIISIIFAIIRKILGIKIKRKAHLLGMAAGVVNFVITFVLIFLPIYGILSLTSMVIKDVDYYQTELNLQQTTAEVQTVANENDDLLLISDTIDNSFVKKYIISPISEIVCKDEGATFDAIYVGNALTFETENGQVKFYDEYKIVKDAFPTIVKIYNIASGLSDGENLIKLSDLTENDIDQLANVLKKSNLLRVALPAIVEVSLYNLSKEVENNELILKLKDINWDQELDSISDIITVIKNHLDVEIDSTSFETIIASPGVANLLKDLINKTLDVSSITDIVLPLAVELLEQELTTQEEFKKYDLDLSGLKQIDFNQDAKGLINCIFNIYQIYLDLNINFSDLKVALNNEQLPEKIEEAFNTVKESVIITDIILPIVIEYTVIKLKEGQGIDIDYESLKEVSWSNNLSSIGSALKEIVEAYQELDIDTDNFKGVLDKPNLPTVLDDVINQVLAVEVIKEYLLPIIMNNLCDKLSEMENLKDFNLDFTEIRKASWQTEIIIFKDTFNAFIKMYQGLKIDPEHWSDVLDDPSLSTYINDIMTNALKSEIIKTYIVPNLASKLTAMMKDNGSLNLSFMEEIITTDNMITLLTDDLDSLIKIMQNLKQMNIFKENQEAVDFSDPVVQNALIEMIKTIFDLKMIEGKEATVVDGLLTTFNLQSQLTGFGVTIDYNNVTDWDSEIDNLCNLFINMMSLTGDLTSFDFNALLNSDAQEEQELIADIVSGVAGSQLFGDSMYDVIKQMINNYSNEFEIEFTEADKTAIETETTWKQEVLTIFKILEDGKTLANSTDYKTLDPELIKSIMLDASDSVIASKIIGKTLNTLFVGVIDQDFTNRKVLRDNVDLVYNAIKLSNILSEPSFDLNEEANVNELITTINNFADNENVTLVSDVLNQIVNPDTPIDITKDDITKTTSTLEEVIDVYQASSNQESFSTSDLPAELATKVENDPLLTAILGFFF